jgi:hypothetical protein
MKRKNRKNPKQTSYIVASRAGRLLRIIEDRGLKSIIASALAQARYRQDRRY